MALLFQEQYKGNDKSTFFPALEAMAGRLGTDPNLFMGMMLLESGLNPQARNSIRATGLTQIMPDTALGLGTTVDALYYMTGTQQLKYIEKYFAPHKGKIQNIYSLYMANFMPAHVDDIDNDSLVIGTGTNLSPNLIAMQNSGFDLNKNGVITIGEFKEFIRRKFQNYPQILSINSGGSLFSSKTTSILLAVGLMGAGVLGVWYMNDPNSFKKIFRFS